MTLLQRLREAKGHDGKLEEDIAAAVNMIGIPPKYTTSLDAALTLVPEGMYWFVGGGKTRPDEPTYGAQVFPGNTFDDETPVGEGETDANAAIALCIAALMARGVE